MAPERHSRRRHRQRAIVDPGAENHELPDPAGEGRQRQDLASAGCNDHDRVRPRLPASICGVASGLSRRARGVSERCARRLRGQPHTSAELDEAERTLRAKRDIRCSAPAGIRHGRVGQQPPAVSRLS